MKQIVISTIALFVLTMALGFVVHGWLLKGEYDASGLMRAEAAQEERFVYMLLAHVLIAVAFTLIYRRGIEDKPWLGQGLRFGLLWAFGAMIPMYLIYHAVMPFELGFALKQCAYDGVGALLMGVVAAAINRS